MRMDYSFPLDCCAAVEEEKALAWWKSRILVEHLCSWGGILGETNTWHFNRKDMDVNSKVSLWNLIALLYKFLEHSTLNWLNNQLNCKRKWLFNSKWSWMIRIHSLFSKAHSWHGCPPEFTVAQKTLIKIAFQDNFSRLESSSLQY